MRHFSLCLVTLLTISLFLLLSSLSSSCCWFVVDAFGNFGHQGLPLKHFNEMKKRYADQRSGRHPRASGSANNNNNDDGLDGDANNNNNNNEINRGRKRGERSQSMTGRLAFDNDLSRLRQDAIAQHSIAPPLLQTNPDSGLDLVSFWDIHGSSVASDKYIRLTPRKETGKEGFLHNRVPCMSYSWVAHLGFRIHGDGSREAGADGIAFWYQRKKSQFEPHPDEQSKHVFGMRSNELTDGIAVAFDTWDNIQHSQRPTVRVLQTKRASTKGAGTATVVDQLDASNNFASAQVGSCERYFRDTADPEHVVIKYDYPARTLLVSFADQHCVHVENIHLIPGGFFGLSSSTGAFTDNHDIHFFILMSNDVKPEDEPTESQGGGGGGGEAHDDDEEEAAGGEHVVTNADANAATDAANAAKAAATSSLGGGSGVGGSASASVSAVAVEQGKKEPSSAAEAGLAASNTNNNNNNNVNIKKKKIKKVPLVTKRVDHKKGVFDRDADEKQKERWKDFDEARAEDLSDD